MFDLSKIYVGGSFYFSSGDNLKTKCKEAKVPNDCCGVYIVYACCEDEESIVYIGSSGHMKDGRYIVRVVWKEEFTENNRRFQEVYCGLRRCVNYLLINLGYAGITQETITH